MQAQLAVGANGLVAAVFFSFGHRAGGPALFSSPAFPPPSAMSSWRPQLVRILYAEVALCIAANIGVVSNLHLAASYAAKHISPTVVSFR